MKKLNDFKVAYLIALIAIIFIGTIVICPYLYNMDSTFFNLLSIPVFVTLIVVLMRLIDAIKGLLTNKTKDKTDEKKTD